MYGSQNFLSSLCQGLTLELQCPVLEDETLINGLLEGMIYHVYHVKTSTEAKTSALF